MKKILSTFTIISIVILLNFSVAFANEISLDEMNEISIEVQPNDVLAELGDDVVLHVEAKGELLSYQWQWKKGGTFWNNCRSTGADTDTFTFKMMNAIDGREYRCVVTKDSNESIISASAIVKLGTPDSTEVITKQPSDVSAEIGDEVALEIVAKGTDLSYQWQWRKDNSGWSNCSSNGAKTDSFKFVMLEMIGGREYRCVVTSNGKKYASNNARITLGKPDAAEVITKQPSDVSAEIGDEVALEIVAKGTDLSYQWQWRKDNSGWSNCSSNGAKTNSFKFVMLEMIGGREYRCVVTRDEKKYVSNNARIILGAPDATEVITKQPLDVLAKIGDEVTLEIETEGTDLSYQWQWRKDNSGWTNCSSNGAKTNSFKFIMLEMIGGREYRCVVTNASGVTYKSDIAQISLKKDEVFALPLNLGLNEKGTLTFSITETQPHTIMLGIYREAAPVRFTKSLRKGASSSVLLAVLPISINGETEYSTNISNFMDQSATYYVTAKAVSSPDEEGARDLSVGATVSSNTVYITRPEESLDTPTGVTWGGQYGRAVWNEVADAVSYQVMLYSGNDIVASRNINTTHFDFSSGWIDFENVAKNEYTFTVTAMSSDITTVSNSPESEHSGVLTAPTDDDYVQIITEPASKYASLNQTASVSIGAQGIGLTYEWFVNGTAAGNLEDDASINVPTDSLGEVEVYCKVTDAFGHTETSETAAITVIDDAPVDTVITGQPESITTDPDGSTKYFSVDLSYSTPFQIEYTWEENKGDGWEVVSSRTYISVSAVAAHNGYQYRCTVKVISPTGRVVCEETSDIASLNINQHTVYIQKDLDSDYWTAGTDSISIIAVGEGEIAYQWYVDGEEVAGATTRVFDISSLTTDSVVYCVASSGEDTAESVHANVHAGENPATGISIYKNYGPDASHLAVGDYVDLRAILSPSKATSQVNWSSSNTSVATVSGGDVWATGFGTATITAESNGYTATYDVTVDSYLIEYNPMGGRFANGSADNKKDRIVAGEAIPLPAISKEGDTFLGWTLDGENVLTGLVADGKKVLIAKWELSTTEEDKELSIEQDIDTTPQYAKIGGNPALFEVVTNGAKVLSYQWYVNTGDDWTEYDSGVKNGSSKTSLEVPATDGNNGWQFKVVITAFRDGTTIESAVGTLVTGYVEDPEELENSFEFTRQPVSIIRTEGEEASFTAAVNSAEATYQWQKDGKDIAGETSSTLTISVVTAEDAGEYVCIATINGESKNSSVATLTVKKQTYTVIYDANGGAFADNETTITVDGISGEYKIASDVPAREGFIFDGWMIDGESVGDTITVSSNVTLTAQWQEEARRYKTVSEAGAVVRAYLANRTGSFSIDVDSSLSPDEIWAEAIKHTGMSFEGDAIGEDIDQYSLSTSTINGVTTLSYTVTYRSSESQEEELRSWITIKVQELTNPGDSDYDKLVAIYQYICANVTYDNSYTRYSAYDAMQGSSVCQGYATLLYRMLEEAGIDCRVVTGKATNSSGNTEDHAWNIVKIDGIYYYVDPTWDSNYGANIGDYKYFLKAAYDDHTSEDGIPEQYTISPSDYSITTYTITWTNNNPEFSYGYSLSTLTNTDSGAAGDVKVFGIASTVDGVSIESVSVTGDSGTTYDVMVGETTEQDGTTYTEYTFTMPAENVSLCLNYIQETPDYTITWDYAPGPGVTSMGYSILPFTNSEGGNAGQTMKYGLVSTVDAVITGISVTAEDGSTVDVTQEEDYEHKGTAYAVYSFIMPASNVTVAIQFEVEAVPDPLVITQDLDSEITVTEGELFTLSVESNKEDATYQWYKKMPGEEAVESSTGQTIDDIQATSDLNGIQFYCVVSCGDQSVTSNVLTVNVESAGPTVTAVSIEASQTSFDIFMGAGGGDQQLWIYSQVEGNYSDVSELTYTWEESTDYGNTWSEAWNENYDDQTTFYRSIIPSGYQSIMYRLTVNGITSDTLEIMIYEHYEEVCMCGCGMPGCTCGPECPMMGGGDNPEMMGTMSFDTSSLLIEDEGDFIEQEDQASDEEELISGAEDDTVIEEVPEIIEEDSITIEE